MEQKRQVRFRNKVKKEKKRKGNLNVTRIKRFTDILGLRPINFVPKKKMRKLLVLL